MHRLDGAFVKHLANAHYNSQYNPPRKAFDFYAAAALVHFIKEEDSLLSKEVSRMFYSGEYGLTLVGKSETWEATLESYVSRIDTKVDLNDSDFIKTKKEYFQREISVMRTIEHLPHLEVHLPLALYSLVQLLALQRCLATGLTMIILLPRFGTSRSSCSQTPRF
jgi:hypothetical protein